MDLSLRRASAFEDFMNKGAKKGSGRGTCPALVLRSAGALDPRKCGAPFQITVSGESAHALELDKSSRTARRR